MSHAIVEKLSQGFKICLPDPLLTGKAQISSIALHETDGTKLGVIQSIIPCVVNCLLEILSTSNKDPALMDFQSFYVPAISKYQTEEHEIEMDELEASLQTLHSEAKKQTLSVYMTLEGVNSKFWASVPHLSRDQSSRWDHRKDPTIYVTPLLDLLRQCSTPDESAHVLAFAFIIIAHELGHLLSCSTLFPHGSHVSEPGNGECREGVMQKVSGEANFVVAYNIDLFDLEVSENLGFRIMGDIRLLTRSKGEEYYQYLWIVVRDKRIVDFLKFFFYCSENLHPNYPIPLVDSGKYTIHSIPLYSQDYKRTYGDTTKSGSPSFAGHWDHRDKNMTCMKPHRRRVPMVQPDVN
ncbi:hypothetical protein BDP27DRAFT_1321796 [Rhodocollybia butyracea]|uniref:Uncharacterized protein n=1 Tax=Rhodocollybia butyracea TaxID=206335 RepID=A0A9P5PSX2_9AGAR|nr:hypothetical protein BDP27DRAFT_1321796 [Rhodocollybia butyracea]